MQSVIRTGLDFPQMPVAKVAAGPTGGLLRLAMRSEVMSIEKFGISQYSTVPRAQ